MPDILSYSVNEIAKRHPPVTKVTHARARHMSRPQALYLIALYRKREWVHVVTDMKDESTASRGDWAKLRFWGLIEEKPNTDKKKKSSGYWRLTDLGKQFVRGEISVPRVKVFRDGMVVETSEELVSITEALGEPFDYRKVA
jgi:hypothetical protein